MKVERRVPRGHVICSGRHVAAAALLLCGLGPTLIAAQTVESVPTVGGVLTLREAIDRAEGKSPSLDSAAAGVRAAEAARVGAGLRPNPSLVVESENIAGTGDYRGLRSAETTAGLEFPIELGGKRSARVAAAGSRANRAGIEAAIALADVRLRVTEAYIDAAGAERSLVLAREQMGIATEGLRVARARVTAGAASPLEQQRAEVARINADVAMQRASRDSAVARENLSRLMGAPVGGSLDLAWLERVDSYGPTVSVDAEGTLAYAAATADVATAQAQLRIAQSQRIPDVTLSASVRRLEATNDRAAVFGLSVPLPLFNSGKAGVTEAGALRDQAEAQRRAALIDAQQAIARARADLENAAATARAAGGPALAAASEAARIARIGYAQGKFGQLDLLEAERTLAETRGAFIEALVAYRKAQAQLERLSAPALLPEVK